MEELLTSDIFFIITAVAVVLVALLMVILLIYLIRIVRNIFIISKKVKTEADEIIEDVGFVRKTIKKGGKTVTKTAKRIVKNIS